MIVKRDHVRKCNVDFGPNIIAKLKAKRNKNSKWKVNWNGATE